MRRDLPEIVESLDELEQRLRQCRDPYQKPRLHVLARLPQVDPEFADFAGLGAGKCLIGRDGSGRKRL